MGKCVSCGNLLREREKYRGGGDSWTIVHPRPDILLLIAIRKAVKKSDFYIRLIWRLYFSLEKITPLSQKDNDTLLLKTFVNSDVLIFFHSNAPGSTLWFLSLFHVAWEQFTAVTVPAVWSLKRSEFQSGSPPLCCYFPPKKLFQQASGSGTCDNEAATREIQNGYQEKSFSSK